MMGSNLSVIEPPCINCQKKGVPCVESATARYTRFQFCNLGKINFSQANHRFPDNPRRFVLEAPFDKPPTSDAASFHSNCELISQGISELLTFILFFYSASLTGSRLRGVQKWNNTNSSWANIGGCIHPQGNPIGVAPEVPILVTRKDGILFTLKQSLVVQDDVDTDAEGSYEIDAEGLEITTPIYRKRIESTSPSPVQANTTTHELIRSPNQAIHTCLYLHQWPALLETQFLQNLNQSLTTVTTGILLEV
ncbi:hypothetical protein O181_021204 [Austropuccinia psidii MF-1]|uniref:Uncharacterized protein n=1 Tax=Austropuccinia psidii MF-1 TaxID=1389203 RepID=A0A9Q3CCQ1_9BASI|nr:hypothetical protein [Austropuccinia psidii MF-1]